MRRYRANCTGLCINTRSHDTGWMKGIEGNWFLVTGSSRGIGRRIAQDIADKKGKLIIHGRADSKPLNQLNNDMSKNGVEVIKAVADISLPDGISTLSDIVRSSGVALRGLVNNAGIYTDSRLKTLDMEEWDTVIDVNLRSHVFLSANLLNFMTPGSSIVNIASVLGMKPAKWGLSYQAAKAALIQMTKSMALDLAPGIRVNCVSPGYVKTEINEEARKNEVFVKQIEKVTPLKRWGESSEVSAVVLFLLSDLASYVTGANLTVSGGLDLR